ncbi:Epidermis-specific secreted glycoprotein EP1 [Spatholobus suberectus]|nr:Epidermis-specific secreted glycoprotein EP1 [Spatholobus suberectus]
MMKMTILAQKKQRTFGLWCCMLCVVIFSRVCNVAISNKETRETFYKNMLAVRIRTPIEATLVGENATFSLGTDGNLVLANADGRIAWQTNTANKGVVAFKLLPNGNIVLLNAKGNFIWQNFDHPTYTFLIDQYLRAKGPSKLVSRLSERKM